jgi:hypothetical protein
MTDHWFPCYTTDLLGSLRWKMMTPAQRGGYWQLICWQMQSEDGHLDADLARLSALADVDISAAANALILEAFPMNGNGRRANPRALVEWKKRQAISGERSKAGSKGMANRWQGHNKRITIANTPTATPTVTPKDTATGTAKSEDTSVPPRRKRTTLRADDSAWLAEVRAEYSKLGIDVDRELTKARVWLLSPKGKGRKLTQQFFINWLSRADRCMPEGAKPAVQSFRNQEAEPIPAHLQWGVK